MYAVYLLCKEDTTLTAFETVSKTNKDFTFVKGKEYKGLERGDILTIIPEDCRENLAYYEISVQDALKIFTTVDVEHFAGSYDTAFRMEPEEYRGFNGTCSWNSQIKLYEGEILDIDEKVTYTGNNAIEINTNFQKAVDNYLSNRKKQNQSSRPDVPKQDLDNQVKIVLKDTALNMLRNNIQLHIVRKCIDKDILGDDELRELKTVVDSEKARTYLVNPFCPNCGEEHMRFEVTISEEEQKVVDEYYEQHKNESPIVLALSPCPMYVEREFRCVCCGTVFMKKVGICRERQGGLQ